MISKTDLQNLKPLTDYAYTTTLPYNDKPMSIIELSKYLNTKYPADEAKKKFNTFVDSKTGKKNVKMVFVTINEDDIMCLKVMTYAELLLFATIVANDASRLAEMKDMMFAADYTNEESFSDAIHMLFMKQAFKKANYELAFDPKEAELDEALFANNVEVK